MVDRDSLLWSAVRLLTPTLLGFGGVVLLAVPLDLFQGTIPTPIIPLAVIYFWSVYSPDHMPTFSTFLIGLLQDFLLGGPLGVWALAYLMTQYFILTQRNYFVTRELHVVWMGFTVAAISFSFMVWLAMSVFAGQWMPVSSFIWQIVVTVLFYRLLVLAFWRVHRRVLVD